VSDEAAEKFPGMPGIDRDHVERILRKD